MRSVPHFTESPILIPEYLNRSTNALRRCAFARPALFAYLSNAARIFIISAWVNGIVGRFCIFGALRSVAGFSSIHFRLSQNRRNARNRSSFLRLERGPSFHSDRKRSSVSRSISFR